MTPAPAEMEATGCDREPIHRPGSIQPHGVLLVVERAALRIEQVAGDTRGLLGIDPASAVGEPLATLLGADVEAFVRRSLSASTLLAPVMFLGLALRAAAPTLDLTVSADEGTVLVELEAARRGAHHGHDPIALLKSLLAALQQSGTLRESLEATVQRLRAITGFDRAMVYQFLGDGTGTVVAEDAAPGLEPFLGLHYPASDIPRQARALYLQNWLRSIPDVGYRPAPLEPARNARTREPIDLTRCTLRSVAPVHLEYLRNMGVAASFGMSVICRGELWGLLMLHHRTPCHVSADLRVACETFAQMFSLHVEATRHAEDVQRRLESRRLGERIMSRLRQAADLGAALACEDLLRYVEASGAVVRIGSTLHTVGATPALAELAPLFSWLDSRHAPVSAYSSLVVAFPRARAWPVNVSGLLAIASTREPADYILWLRPELPLAIRWAGDPSAKGAGPAAPLSPRASFAEWRETRRWRSAPWTAEDLEAAEAFRVAMLETLLEQVDRARQEREAALERQNVLLAELDHRTKNSLALIQSLVHSSRVGAVSVAAYADSLERRIQALATAHTLLAGARWTGASLRKLLREETALMLGDGPQRVTLTGADLVLSPFAAVSMSLVLHEMVTNAMKYGALSTPAGTVAVSWAVSGAPPQLRLVWHEQRGPPPPVSFTPGFGMRLILGTVGYELSGRADFRCQPDGLCCELSIPLRSLAEPAT